MRDCRSERNQAYTTWNATWNAWPRMRRIKVWINDGRADGGVLVMLGTDATNEEFIASATKKFFKKDAAAAAAIDSATARIYLSGGEFEAELDTMMHDEEVVLAFHGSPIQYTSPE